MKNKKKRKVFLLVLLVLGISIGFAALATTLRINGVTFIGRSAWNIYWDNIHNQTGKTPSVSEIVDEDTNHKKNIINFAVTFDEPGDYYEFDVDAVNAGNLDAEVISIEKKYNDTVIPENPTEQNPSPLPAYLKFIVTYDDGSAISIRDGLGKATVVNHEIVPTRKTYKIRVEYDRENVTIDDINNQTGPVEHNFEFKVEYGQYIPPDPDAFDTDPWPTIVDNIDRDPTIYPIGVTRPIEIDTNDDGEPETYTLRLVNTTPCSLASQTACGIVFQIEGLPDRRMNPEAVDATPGTGNLGGWPASEMRAYLNSGVHAYTGTDFSTTGLYSKLPAEIRNSIIPTTVVSGWGCISGGSVTFSSCTNPDNEGNLFTSVDKIYLLATHEVWEDGRFIDNETFGIHYFNKEYNSTRQLDWYSSLGINTLDCENQTFSFSRENYTFWTRSADMRWNYIFEQNEQYNGTCWRTQGASLSILSPLAAFRIG